MCTICKILHYICTKEKRINQTKSYEIHKRKLLCRTSKNGCSGCILYICLLSHQQKLAEKRLYFILTAIHRHLRLFVTPCLSRGKNCRQTTLPPDYENKHNKLKIVCNRIILFCMHTFALSCYINL